MNELKAYLDGLLASGAAMIPREAVEKVKAMVDKLPKVITSVGVGGGGGGAGGNIGSTVCVGYLDGSGKWIASNPSKTAAGGE